MSFNNRSVSVIIPAHNEAPCIAQVVSELRALRSPDNHYSPLIDDLIVCNNGSTDATAELASKAGANVFDEFRLGYGFACLRGIEKMHRPGAETPDYVIFIDGDHSVKADEVITLLESLAQGNDLVVGKRVAERQEDQALSPHQIFGNNLASNLVRWIWKKPITDLGPFRAIRYRSLMKLDMQDQRFGWTVEMQVKVIQANMRYAEVPVTTQRRIGKSKISGTVRGTIGAAHGIFSKVFILFLLQPKFIKSLNQTQTAHLAD